MLRKMQAYGGVKNRYVCKIAGGAKMFEMSGNIGNIGAAECGQRAQNHGKSANQNRKAGRRPELCAYNVDGCGDRHG